MKAEPIYVADTEEEAIRLAEVIDKITEVRGGKSEQGETIHVALCTDITDEFKCFQQHLNDTLRLIGFIAPNLPESISRHNPYFVRYEASKNIHIIRCFSEGKTIFAELRDEDTEKCTFVSEESIDGLRASDTKLFELKTQVGGDHYAKCAIQPIDYIMANGLDYLQGNVIKYVTRYKNKNGVEDLEKAAHYLRIMIEREKQKSKQETT